MATQRSDIVLNVKSCTVLRIKAYEMMNQSHYLIIVVKERKTGERTLANAIASLQRRVQNNSESQIACFWILQVN